MPEWTATLRARLASLSLSPAREAEIVEELSQHLDQRYDELRAGGTSEAEARRLAMEELLDRDALADRLRGLRQAHSAPPIVPGAASRSPLDGLRQDFRYTARTLRQQRVFSAAAVLTLGLGIGATTAIFSVVNGVLIKPLPYADPDALVRIVHSIGGVDQPYFSDAIYLAYVDNTRAFDDLGVWSPGETATITGRGDPEDVRTLTATRGVLTTLGVRPGLGRWFSTADLAPGAPDAVMLTHGYWQRRFGGDRGVLERALTVNGRPHQIVGVMPPGFGFGGDVEILLPLRIDRGAPVPAFRLLGVARLKPGVTMAQANADVVRVLHAWFETAGVKPEVRTRWAPALQPLKQDVIGDVGRTLGVLMGAIGLVLLMACANVANLLLVRVDARRQESAIRAALGATWTRIARQFLIESLALALLGGALGVALAYAGLRALVAIGPSNLPRLSEISIDPLVLGFALAISLVSGLLFGLVPIVMHLRPRLMDAIVSGGRAASLTRERQRSQQVLVAAQMALALVLLVSAGLMIRSFQALRSVDPGFTRPEHLQTFSISIPASIVAEPVRVTRMQHDVLDRIAAIPGVASAAFTTRLPMGSDRSSAALTVEGQPDDGRTPPNRQVKIVSPGLLRTQGTPLVAGRDFTWSDLYDMRDVAIVSENLARELWGSPAAALGKRVREYYDKDSAWREVVGVAGDVHDDGVDQPPPATIYWPAHPDEKLLGMSGYQSRRISVAIRTERAGTPDLLDRVHEAVWAVSATLPLSQVRRLDEVYRQSMARTSFTLVMLAIAGAMALLLGISGIYGVVSYAVSRRRREIGIRLALGARPTDIRGLFVRRGVTLGAAGLALGLAGALGSTRLMESLLFGISPLDPLTFLAMPLVLVAAAVLASYLPARRAVAIDPVETMRAE
jgi:predicted permease